jgi:hypothetical protein
MTGKVPRPNARPRAREGASALSRPVLLPPGNACADPFYLNAPFLSPENFQQAFEWLTRDEARPHRMMAAARQRSAPGTGTLTRLDRLFLPAGRYTRDDVLQAQLFADSWTSNGFTYAEICTWLGAGLQPHEAGTASLLIEEGISIDRLHEACQNRVTNDPSTVVEVARRLPQFRAYNPEATLGELLDLWMVARTPIRRRTSV